MFDIITFELQENSIVRGVTEAGKAWLEENIPILMPILVQTNGSFEDFLYSIPKELSIGVTDEQGRVYNFRSGVLH